MGKGPNIKNIWGIPLFGGRKCWICGRLSQLFGIFTCKSRENMDLDCSNHHHVVQHAKIRCLHPCVSCLVMNLGTRTKCRHFPSYGTASPTVSNHVTGFQILIFVTCAKWWSFSDDQGICTDHCIIQLPIIAGVTSSMCRCPN